MIRLGRGDRRRRPAARPSRESPVSPSSAAPGPSGPSVPVLRHHAEELFVDTPGEGLHEVTDRVAAVLGRAGVRLGTCTVFIRHTSASLLVQENADPSARRDLERWLARLAPPGDRLYTHVAEGPDDMPSHIRAALTATSLTIPVVDGRLTLGTWQGVYVWEHRAARHRRRVMVLVAGEAPEDAAITPRPAAST